MKEAQMEPSIFFKGVPWKNIIHFGMKDKLASRYIGPFEIMERVEPVTYQLALPGNLSKINDVFHVSLLQKAEVSPSHIFPQVLIKVKEDLTL
jgi:hypothetical protein